MKTKNQISNSVIEMCKLLAGVSSDHVDQRSDPMIVKDDAFHRIAGMFLPRSKKNRVVQAFVESCCEKGADFQIRPDYVYYAYCKWGAANGYGYKSPDELEVELKLLGITKKYVDGRSYWVGITSKPE